jgi:hypothetical protein
MCKKRPPFNCSSRLVQRLLPSTQRKLLDNPYSRKHRLLFFFGLADLHPPLFPRRQGLNHMFPLRNHSHLLSRKMQKPRTGLSKLESTFLIIRTPSLRTHPLQNSYWVQLRAFGVMSIYLLIDHNQAFANTFKLPPRHTGLGRECF